MTTFFMVQSQTQDYVSVLIAMRSNVELGIFIPDVVWVNRCNCLCRRLVCMVAQLQTFPSEA